MPYKDPIARRTYAREWVAENRRTYFANRVCEFCHQPSPDLTMLAQEGMTFNHRCWTWNVHRRNMELWKAWCLCPPCRKAELARRRTGTLTPAEHGTTTRYRRGCRCKQCTQADAAAKKSWKAKNAL